MSNITNAFLDDIILIKIDKNANIEYEKSFGGSSIERVYSIIQTSDNGYIFAGFTGSNDGDVSGNNGFRDCWVVKLDNMLNIEWQKCLGGSHYDRANSIIQTADNGFIIAGYTASNDGDVSGNNGYNDFWVVKLDQNANIEWQKCFGGRESDWAWSIIQTNDEGYTIAGQSYGGISGNLGRDDFLIIKVDQYANIEWEKRIGGTEVDIARSILQKSDGGFIISGTTKSNNGHVQGNHGQDDIWVVNLCISSPITIQNLNPYNYCYNTLEATSGFESYLWNTGDTTQTIEVTEEGTYFVSAMNDEGCPSEAEITIDEPEPIPLNIEIANPNYCYSTELTAIGDFETYLWSTGDTTQTITIYGGAYYRVLATNETGCQSEAGITVLSPEEPFNEATICMVTLDETTQKNKIIYEPFQNVGVDSVRLYRLSNQTSDFDWMGSKYIDEIGEFIDLESNPMQQSEQYKLAIRDTCGKVSNLSPVHQTMLLQANTGINGEVNLFWNAYIGFDYPNFGIYRKLSNGEYFLIANVPNNVFTFTDNTPPAGELKYQIRVEIPSPCNPSSKEYLFVGSNPVVLNSSGTEQMDLLGLEIIPNPFGDHFMVVRDKSATLMNIQLLDIQGRILSEYIFKSGETSLNVSTSKLPKGVYYLRFNNEFSKKLVKSY